MSRILFTVEDRFLIRGRGLILVPGLPARSGDQFRAGDSIVLNRPDGSRLPWTIGALEMIFEQPVRPPSERNVAILLLGLGKDDVPVGTEVWTVDSGAVL